MPSITMLNVVIQIVHFLGVIMPIVIKSSVIMPSAILLNVVAPFLYDFFGTQSYDYRSQTAIGDN